MSQSVPGSTKRPIRGYIEAKLADETAITHLRDRLYERTGAATNFRRIPPHLTLIPPFTIDETQVDQVNRLLETSPLHGRTIPITGVGVWPSIVNPRVVLLTTPVDIEQERSRLATALEELGARDCEAPVRPHITLFKTDNGYTVSPSVKQSIHRAIGDNRFQWETTAAYIDFVVVSP